jgi:hypothetical protein
MSSRHLVHSVGQQLELALVFDQLAQLSKSCRTHGGVHGLDLEKKKNNCLIVDIEIETKTKTKPKPNDSANL